MTLNDIERTVLLKGYERWRTVIEFIVPECPHEIAAIAFRESTWNPKAERYESQWHEDYILADTDRARDWRQRIGKTGYQEQKFATSWGLMQIIGLVAYERGYYGDPEGLLVPEMSLLYGSIHFKHLWEQYQNIKDAIAAYNAGSPDRLNGKYVNQDYVDFVLAAQSVLAA